MKKPLFVCAVIGFVVPLMWGILSFVLFTAPQSRFADLYWAAVYITCPPWGLPALWGSIVMPFANAALYAGIAYCLISVRRVISGKH